MESIHLIIGGVIHDVRLGGADIVLKLVMPVPPSIAGKQAKIADIAAYC